MTAIPPVSSSIPGIAARQAPTPEPSLGSSFTGALDSVAGAVREADAMTRQAATGQLEDLSQLTTATAKAELAVELTVAFRDRAVGAFQQIMQMPV